MIHDVPNQLKFKRLARLLRPLCAGSVLSAESIAVGILERLWHAAIDNSQAGDIGKLSDVDIAESVGWLGDASTLIDALVETRWLDRCSTHRLVIHDWHEHCPNFVKGNFSKHGKQFAIATCLGNVPKQRAQPSEQPAIATTPNLTKPNLTDLTEPDLPSGRAVSQDFFKERWQEICVEANRTHVRIDPERKLTPRNRQLVVKLVVMSLLDSEAKVIIERQIVATSEKMRTDKPAVKPWGWLKSVVITAFKSAGKEFDPLWDSIEIPAELLARRPA